MAPSYRFLKSGIKVTLILVGINVVVFVLSELISILLRTDQLNVLYLFGAEYFPDIIGGQVWRVVLPAFLHANILHLFVNMWALLNIGPVVENFYGAKKLVSVYVITGICASLLSAAVTAITYFGSGGTNQSFAVSVGASGAIFGLIGLLLGNNYKSDTYAPKIPVDTNQLWFFVAFNVILGFGINSFGGSIAVNNAAHVGGLLSGFILGLVLDPVNTYYKSKLKKYFESFLFPLALVILFVSVVLNILFNFA
jgi:rhomboid protease GluP